ncbi:hypothetical protein P8452_42254 [Trifolium repens]|nr:hypothetical protein QL285_026668 [Trifolium repens]WJX56609.1 hypothetical protein P8452_42254 [Trifolium repens]
MFRRFSLSHTLTIHAHSLFSHDLLSLTLSLTFLKNSRSASPSLLHRSSPSPSLCSIVLCLSLTLTHDRRSLTVSSSLTGGFGVCVTVSGHCSVGCNFGVDSVFYYEYFC